ncbi:MAG: rhomboid family intramembrane serine protease [Gammaproteobacteria bacterium]|nr:rhomboid family intramembrane serine protease [Gammaproteobacteria bacterium]
MVTEQHNKEIYRSQRIAAGVFGCVVVAWLIHIVALVADLNLASLGIRPLVAGGLVGVLTAPLVHGSWGHLISNTLPLLILGTALIYITPRAARIAIPVIWLGSGLGVWLFARESIHIGASGLTYGMLFYLFIIGILRRDRQSIALTLLVFFLYGGMIWGVFPLAPGISFEYHLFGALAGVICAFVLKGLDPLPERKRYEWEDEEFEEDKLP